jgi:hypothetical protein
MIDQNIKRFCEIVAEINELNKYLTQEIEKFYDGGHTFEECYSTDIKKLVELQEEFKSLLIPLTT